MEKEIVPTPQGFQVVERAPDQSASGVFYKRQFTDDDAPGAYDFLARTGESRVFVRELGENALEAYLDAQKDIDARNQELRAHAQAPGAEGIARQLVNRQRALALEVLRQSVIGWELRRPFAPDALEQLSMTARMSLASQVVRGSTLGGTDDAPLPDGS